MGFWEDTTTFANSPQAAESAEVTVRVFDPLTEVSADAKYIVRRLVLWFLVLPLILGALLWAVTR